VSTVAEIVLSKNVLPISRAASALAALIKRAATERVAIIVTQKGYPTGVLQSVEQYERQHEQAEAMRARLAACDTQLATLTAAAYAVIDGAPGAVEQLQALVEGIGDQAPAR
jgi:prevent-host-death family protein